jgi:hypothetical protein
MADGWPGFQHERRFTACQDMRGGSQPNRAGADDRDGQACKAHDAVFRNLEAAGAATEGRHAAPPCPQQFSVRKPTRPFMLAKSAA